MKKKQWLSYPGFVFYGAMAWLELFLDQDFFPIFRAILMYFAEIIKAHRSQLRVLARWLGLFALLGSVDASVNLAFAAGGISGWFSYFISNVIQPAIDFVKWGCYIAGIVIIAVAISKMLQLSKPQHQVTAMEVFVWFGGGGLLCGVGYMAQLWQETMSAGNVSGTPT